MKYILILLCVAGCSPLLSPPKNEVYIEPLPTPPTQQEAVSKIESKESGDVPSLDEVYDLLMKVAKQYGVYQDVMLNVYKSANDRLNDARTGLLNGSLPIEEYDAVKRQVFEELKKYQVLLNEAVSKLPNQYP